MKYVYHWLYVCVDSSKLAMIGTFFVYIEDCLQV